MTEHFSVRRRNYEQSVRGTWLQPMLLAGAAVAVLAANGQTQPRGDSRVRALSPGSLLRRQPFVVLYRMDLAGNRDGFLDPEEIPRGAEGFVQRLTSESKVASLRRTPLRKVAVAWHGRARVSPVGFPKSKVIQPDRSRSAPGESTSSHRNHAANFLGLYDRDADGSLDQDEWNHIGAGWGDADVDGNGLLSLEELSARFGAYAQPPTDSEDDSPPNESGDEPEVLQISVHDELASESAVPFRRGQSYRRPTPHERLPAGIPEWYIQKDTDLDGQIMMYEFSKAWDDGQVAEFARYDLNADGIITPRECLRIVAP